MNSQLKKETSTALGNFNVDLKTNEITYTDESRYILGLAESCNRSFDYFLTRLHPNSIGLVHRVSNMGVNKKTNFRLTFSLGFGKKKNFLARGKIIYDSFNQPEHVLWSILKVGNESFFERIKNKGFETIFTTSACIY